MISNKKEASVESPTLKSDVQTTKKGKVANDGVKEKKPMNTQFSYSNLMVKGKEGEFKAKKQPWTIRSKYGSLKVKKNSPLVTDVFSAHNEQSKVPLEKKKDEEPRCWADVKESEEKVQYELMNHPLDEDHISGVTDDDEMSQINDDLNGIFKDIEDPLGIGNSGKNDGLPTRSRYSIVRSRSPSTKLHSHLLDMNSEEFNTFIYLTSFYSNASMEDLLKGKAHLEKTLTTRQRQLEFLVKDNFSLFIACKDVIHHINAEIDAEKPPFTSEVIAHAQLAVSSLTSYCKDVFSPLIDRKNEIDRIRSVLSILKRSQFIFKLPQRIRDYIETKEYNKAVLNYRKVKSFVGSHSHASIKDVMADVESIVNELRETLFKLMEKPKTTLKQQEVIINQLVDLDSPTDPAWSCILLRHDTMKRMLTDILLVINSSDVKRVDYSLAFPESKSPIIEASSVLKEYLLDFVKLSTNFRNGIYHKNLNEHSAQIRNQRLEELTLLLEDISKIYCDIVITAFYGRSKSIKMAAQCLIRNKSDNTDIDKKMISKGKEGPNSTSLNYKTASSGCPLHQTPREGGKQGSSSQITNFSESSSVKRIMTHHAAASLIEYSHGKKHETSSTSNPIVVISDKQIAVAVLDMYDFLCKNNTPKNYWSYLSQVCDVILRTFVSEAFYTIDEDSKAMYLQETWEVNNQQLMITSVPLSFERMILALLDDIEAVVRKDDPLIIFVQKKLIECVVHFLDNICKLAFDQSKAQSTSYHLSPLIEDDTGFLYSKSISQDTRLLILFNHCTYAKKKIIPTLETKFKEHYDRFLFYSGSFDGMQHDAFIDDLSEKIKKWYVNIKISRLNDVIEDGLLHSGYDWKRTCVLSWEIRSYVMDALLHLLSFQDEIFRKTGALLLQIMPIFLENVYKSFMCCFNEIEDFSKIAALQVGMELMFISTILSKYETSKSRELFSEVDTKIQYSNMMDPDSDIISIEDKEAIRKALDLHLGNVRLLFQCFRIDNPNM